VRVDPIRPGLTFHELRHSPKTWLIAAGIPEIAQARRLGHRMDRRVIAAYSHVADEVEARIQTALKQAWFDARLANASHPATPAVTARDGRIRRHLAGPAAPRKDRQELPRVTTPPRPTATPATHRVAMIEYGARRSIFTHTRSRDRRR
jgi:hypothetical protein